MIHVFAQTLPLKFEKKKRKEKMYVVERENINLSILKPIGAGRRLTFPICDRCFLLVAAKTVFAGLLA
jgi:hypothetical protein